MRALRKPSRLQRLHRAPALAALVALAAALLGSGCAFTSKGEALTPRYFSPAPASEPPEPAAPEGAPAPPELRIGRIEPAAHLEERIAYRISDSELAYYEDRRWTEPPEQFVRRALERELFESHAFRRVISGAAPTLDVEVLSFEEVRPNVEEGLGTPRARLSLLITLRDERHALLERTLSIEAPLELGSNADEGRALARAMAGALGRATRDVAERVAAELRQQASSSVAAQRIDEPSEAQPE
jgi:cholesterol transport system auxiliary component